MATTTIITLICDPCGATQRHESDDQRFCAERALQRSSWWRKGADLLLCDGYRECAVALEAADR